MNWQILKKPLKLFIGTVMFVVGVITAPIPLPIGQIIALIGLSILVSESKWVKTNAQKMRRKIPIFSRQLISMHPYLPKFLKKVVDYTDPTHLA